MGWLPDHPDYRAYTVSHDAIKPVLTKAKIGTEAPKSGPSAVHTGPNDAYDGFLNDYQTDHLERGVALKNDICTKSC